MADNLARTYEVKEAKRDLRNGALLAVGFVLLPLLLSTMFGGGLVVVAAFPIFWGVIMMIRGAVNLARYR